VTQGGTTIDHQQPFLLSKDKPMNLGTQQPNVYSSDDLPSQLLQIVATATKASSQDITNETNFASDLGLDSIKMVEMIMAVERALNITVEDEDIEKIETFAQLVSHITTLKQLLETTELPL
jgi:NADH dehydrogenase (ubiquinone) 1 alpha/beta subcomplex 1